MKKRLLIFFFSVFAFISAFAQTSKDISLGENVISLLRAHDYERVLPFVHPTSRENVDSKVLNQLITAVEMFDWSYFSGPITESLYSGPQLKGNAVMSTGSVFRIVQVYKSHLLASIYIEPLLNTMKGYHEPNYRDSTIYIESPITIKTEQFIMGGTYTVPKALGKFPIVVFVHGSGANNRDEALSALKPFRDISYGLAAKGIASLRYDKRNRIYGKAAVSAGSFNTIAQETLDDVNAAIQLAKKLPGVDPKRVYVLGHSQGGMMLPRILADNKILAGGIFMAAPSIPLYKSYEQIYNSSIPMHEATRQAALREIEEIKNADTIKNDQRMLIGQPAGFWKDINRYNQLTEVKGDPQPMLLLQGERDYQVFPSNIDDWKKALINHTSVTFKIYPKINHFFSEGEGPASASDYYRSGNVPVYVISDISGWIQSQEEKQKAKK